MAGSNDKIKKKIDLHLGEGYYDFVLKAGIVAGVPAEKLAKELETSVANIVEMRKEYGKELSDIMVHRAIAEQVFQPLVNIRMTKLMMKLLDQVDEDLTMGGLPPNVKSDLLKFFAKYITNTKTAEASDLPDIDEDEFKERALRLVTETA